MNERHPSMEDVWLLVKRVQEGDLEAFGKIYQIYYDQVFGTAYRLLQEKTSAEDVTADVFLSVLRNIGNYHPNGREFVAVLHRSVRNAVIDRQRRAIRRPEVLLDLQDAGDLFGVVSSVENTVLGVLDSEELWGAVKGLQPRWCECIVLRFFLGLSIAETAKRMDTTTGAVKTLQYRATESLKRSLRNFKIPG